MVYKDFVKPLLDFTLAFFMILILLPIYLIVSFLIYIKLGSPIVFAQKRPGKNEKIFTIYKFRSMSDEKDKDGKLLSDEKRLGTFGKLLRKSSLDELPQLFNVLKFEMSFIGPRPLLVEYLKCYNDEQKKRHSVKPGISGLAQVNGRNAISWEEKFKLDVEYVENISFLLDIKILWLTFLKVINRSDVSSNTNVTMEKFCE